MSRLRQERYTKREMYMRRGGRAEIGWAHAVDLVKAARKEDSLLLHRISLEAVDVAKELSDDALRVRSRIFTR